jgi:hypothetical protein
MPLLLIQLAAHPDEIAATFTEACLPNGAFFLDFSRPLARQRFCGVWNARVGITMALVVPVVHQGQAQGRLVIVVDRGDPYCKELQRLWQERYPTARGNPGSLAASSQVMVDFETQFPGQRGTA